MTMAGSGTTRSVTLTVSGGTVDTTGAAADGDDAVSQHPAAARSGAERDQRDHASPTVTGTTIAYPITVASTAVDQMVTPQPQLRDVPAYSTLTAPTPPPAPATGDDLGFRVRGHAGHGQGFARPGVRRRRRTW